MSKIISWLKTNYMWVAVPIGTYSLYKIVSFFSKQGGTGVNTKVVEGGYTKKMKYPTLMDTILKGESHSYNDHNYYKGGSLNGYVQGKYGRKYGALLKNLSDYTIGEIMAWQANSRSSDYGQLWAVGRYQIIPVTLKGAVAKAGLKSTDKFSPENQDKLGMALLQGRPNAWKYISKQVPDTAANLQAAAFDLAREWSSVGMPFATTGFWRVPVGVNESYYKPNDRATTKTEDIQKALKKSRTA